VSTFAATHSPVMLAALTVKTVLILYCAFGAKLHSVLAPFNAQGNTKNKTLSRLVAGSVYYSLKGSPGYIHSSSRLFLIHTFQVRKPDSFGFVYGEHYFFFGLAGGGALRH
jgi:hypothetical protein